MKLTRFLLVYTHIDTHSRPCSLPEPTDAHFLQQHHTATATTISTANMTESTEEGDSQTNPHVNEMPTNPSLSEPPASHKANDHSCTHTASQRPDDAVLLINAGGTQFATTAGTLRACGEGSVPYTLANASQSPPPFLDRDADMFAAVLRWARGVRFGAENVLPKTMTALAMEARALRIPALTSAIQSATAVQRRVRALISTKTTIIHNGRIVDGHFVVAGQRSSTTGSRWFGAFKPETLHQDFDDKVAAAVDQYSQRYSLVPVSSTVATNVFQLEVSRFMHVLTLTWTFAAPQ